ncbi:MAG: LamG domain-containing protein, partial [Kamptonema sp. SIO4C4]|nr:LamG domain-containing protein [Kamptonema sp. SIO4C4]
MTSSATVSTKTAQTSQQSILAFDGQDDYIDLGKKAAYKIAQTLTLEAWIYVTSQTQWASIIGNIFDTGATESGYSLLLDGSSGCYFTLKITSTGIQYLHSGANTINLNQWHHIAGTYDGQTMKLYIE